ncbi:hypothetical protein [Nonomuraea jabiensis]
MTTLTETPRSIADISPPLDGMESPSSPARGRLISWNRITTSGGER